MSFTMRTSKPSGNKFYITKGNGGYSTCVVGSPTDRNANVLANCVGYACGRFNEIIGSMKYPSLNCNAENFIERAKAAGLKVGSTPKVGAIMCWMKGATLSGNDGAGHVAIVEKVNSNSSVYTSESGWGGPTFWNATRTNSNGRWGMASGYTFRGFIYLPDSAQPSGGTTTKVTPTVSKNTANNQIEVKISDLNVRTGAGTGYSRVGFASKGYYNYYETKSTNGYTWYRIANGQWVAYNKAWFSVLPKKTSTSFKVGDKVKPIKLVDYNGKKVTQYDGWYQITSINGNRAVLAANRGGKLYTWAALNTNNIKKI